MADARQAALAFETALRSGRLRDSLPLIEEAVRKAPGSLDLRVRLFQVLLLLGQWDRARHQLSLLPEFDRPQGDDSPHGDLAFGVPAWVALLDSEVERREVLGGRRPPRVLGEPGDWLALQAEVIRLIAQREFPAAARAVDRAREATPAPAGIIDGEAFAWIADADPRFGAVLEIVVERQYYWLPFDRMRKLEMEAPSNLQDRVWQSCTVELATGGTLGGYLPVRYPGSETSTDDAVVMGAVSEWSEPGGGLSLGMGQRLLATDVADKPLLKIRRIEIVPTG